MKKANATNNSQNIQSCSRSEAPRARVGVSWNGFVARREKQIINVSEKKMQFLCRCYRPFITHGATMSELFSFGVLSARPISEVAENPSTTLRCCRCLARERNIRQLKKRNCNIYCAEKKYKKNKRREHYPISALVGRFAGTARSREESVWCGGNVMWWETQKAKEMERRATEEPESVVNTRIYTIFISPKMESFSRHYQWPEIQVFLFLFLFSLSPNFFTIIAIARRRRRYTRVYVFQREASIFRWRSLWPVPSSRAHSTEYDEERRKKRNSRENQNNKNPREEEGRRVEMGQKKRRLGEKAAKKCFKEFKWFQSVIRRVQTGFSAELRVECALLLFFLPPKKKLAFKRLFLNEIFSLMKGKASPSTAGISDNNNKSCACMQLLCAANLQKKYKS